MSAQGKANKMRFRRKAIPGFRESREPTAGDLRTPIAIYRSARAPSANAQFVKTLTAYRTCFSKFDSAPERFLLGENAEPNSTHLFTIRWDGSLRVEGRDYIQKGVTFYKVEFTKVFGRMGDWLNIFCTEHFEGTANENLVIAPTKIDSHADPISQHNSGWDLPNA